MGYALTIKAISCGEPLGTIDSSQDHPLAVEKGYLVRQDFRGVLPVFNKKPQNSR